MLRVVVIVLVFVGAIFVFASQKPEQVFGQSADGIVMFEGVSGRVRSIHIELLPAMDTSLSQCVSSYYLVTPDLAGVTFSGTLTVRIVEQWKQLVEDPTELVIYVYDSPEEGWHPLLTQVDLSQSTLHAPIDLSQPVWIAVGTPPTLNVEK